MKAVSGREHTKQKRYLKLLAFYGDQKKVAKWVKVGSYLLAKWRKARRFLREEVAALEKARNHICDFTSVPSILSAATVLLAMKRNSSKAAAQYASVEKKVPAWIRTKVKAGMEKEGDSLFFHYLNKCAHGDCRPGIWSERKERVARIIAENRRAVGPDKMAKSRMLRDIGEANAYAKSRGVHLNVMRLLSQ